MYKNPANYSIHMTIRYSFIASCHFRKYGAIMMDLTKMKSGIYKSRGGLIRSFVIIENGLIKDITISGDFFLFPEEAIFSVLEHLKGAPVNRDEIKRNIEETYLKENIQSPGTSPADFTES